MAVEEVLTLVRVQERTEQLIPEEGQEEEPQAQIPEEMVVQELLLLDILHRRRVVWK
jgi:hypothetical protein